MGVALHQKGAELPVASTQGGGGNDDDGDDGSPRGGEEGALGEHARSRTKAAGAALTVAGAVPPMRTAVAAIQSA